MIDIFRLQPVSFDLYVDGKQVATVTHQLAGWQAASRWPGPILTTSYHKKPEEAAADILGVWEMLGTPWPEEAA